MNCALLISTAATHVDRAACESVPQLCQESEIIMKATRARPASKYRRYHTQPITIDLHTVPLWWYGPDNVIFDELRRGEGCSVKCDARWNWKGHQAMAQMHRMAPPDRRGNQITIVETGEPQFIELLDKFNKADIIVSSDPAADVINVPIPKQKLYYQFLEEDPPTLSTFTTPFYSGIFVGNCIRPRLTWLEAIHNIAPLKSYGGCMHTPGASCPRESKQCHKITEASKFPFAIAFENHPMQPGYVSEKMFQAFASNSLPVVWSSLSAHMYTPGKDSYIDAADFESPEALANYLVKVRNNETLYNSFFAWRQSKRRVKQLKRTWNKFGGGGKEAVCGMCEAIYASK